MKTNYRNLLAAFAAVASFGLSHAATTVQDAGNVVGTGDKAWSYLVLEAENYESESDGNPESGFTRVTNNSALTNSLGNPVLGPDTTASGKAALYTLTPFARHIDKVTYNVQFSKPGTYYLFMRFTMFENAGNAGYLSEDSFFVPPDFNRDPQTDWPLSDGTGQNGGYTEGCCDATGFLFINEGGTRVNHSTRDETAPPYWEGNFHWNELISSQFLNAETQGEPRVRFRYVVTDAQVGKPLSFTISYREGGLTVDQFLFSTNPDLMEQYSQTELDQLFVKDLPKVSVQQPTDVVGAGANAWSYLIVEGEDYAFEADGNPEAGFTRVTNNSALTNSLGNPVLGPDTTASKKGALYTLTPFARHADKVTYNVQFAKAGTYYLFMRFTMFENAGNTGYLSEDSFFVPPDFNKDPQTDWPLSDGNGQNGGYTEGCCDATGFLFINEGGTRVNHSTRDETAPPFWEGNFHWNELISSQFLNAETQGEPRVRFKYVVSDAQVGKPLKFTISYREGGLTVDQFLFSTNPDLMEQYSQTALDQLFVKDLPKVSIQTTNNVVGTGAEAWSYLKVEGEDFAYDADANPLAGFTRVDNTGTFTDSLGTNVLASDTTASGKAALYTATVFGRHVDKATYLVQFAKPGTYYVYMRFTMFENGGNTSYLNEDSFFLPPDFDKDPQTDWPLSDANGQNGGYTEGCCDAAGFLFINEGGTRVSHSARDEAAAPFFEGNFHWNELLSSQFLNAETQGEPRVRFKYVVTDAQVGKPMKWTISYREGGLAVDAFLFSTSPDLMLNYSQADLDRLVLGASAPSGPSLTATRSGQNVVISWTNTDGFILESTDRIGGTWTAASGPLVVNGTQSSVTVSSPAGMKFYRLKKL